MPSRQQFLAYVSGMAALWPFDQLRIGALMTDTDNLDDLANAIAKSSPKIRDYAIAQAAATQSQELDIRSALQRIAALEAVPPPDPEPEPEPPPGDVVVVPASIDGTGQTDVTQPLYNWINSQPAGKTLDMRSKTFRIDGQMYFNGKSGWTFDLRGTTIRETTIGDGHQSKFKFWNGGSIAFLCEGAKFLGAFPTPGVHDAANQWGHALDFLGVQGVSVDGGFAQNMCGDGVYVGASSQPCRNVNVREFSSTGVGRNGVSVTGGEGVVIDGGTHDNSGFICIDIEPNAQAGFTCRNISVRRLTLGKYRLAALGVIGHNVVDGVTFEDIRLTSSENKQRVGFGWEALGPSLTTRFKNIAARRITADNPSSVGFGASRIDGLTIQDCVMPVSTMLRKRDVTGLVFSGNSPSTVVDF